MSSQDTKLTPEARPSEEPSLPSISATTLINPDVAPQLPARPATTDAEIHETASHAVSGTLADIRAQLKGQQGLENLASKVEAEVLTQVYRLIGGSTESGATVPTDYAALTRIVRDGLTISKVQDMVASGDMAVLPVLEAATANLRQVSQDAHDLSLLNQLESILRQARQQATAAQHAARLAQQNAQEAESQDDDAGGGGPEKVDDVEGGLSSDADFQDLDTDADVSTSKTRSKKGKARDRGARKKSWLARMARAFKRQNFSARLRATQTRPAAKKTSQENKFIKTCRIKGRIIELESGRGLSGVKVVSNTLGETLTGADGGFSFENVLVGATYTLAPVAKNYKFEPRSVNDTAEDSREHFFKARYIG